MLGLLFGVLLFLGGYAGNIANEDLHIIGYIMMALGALIVLSKVFGLLKSIFGFMGDLLGVKKETAYWIQRTHISRADEYVCSSCGRCFKKPYSHCPNCGLKITKTKYDPNWVDEVETMDAMFGD